MKRNDHTSHPLGTSADGTPIVGVKLTSGEIVALSESDFTALQARGLTHGWYLSPDGQGRTYVALNVNRGSRSSPTTLARLILDLKTWQRAAYRDGNRLNLCRDNLYVAKSWRETGLKLIEAEATEA